MSDISAFEDIPDVEVNEALQAPPEIDASGVEVPAPPPDVQIYAVEGPDFRSYVQEGDTDLITAYVEQLSNPVEAAPKKATRRKKK